MKVKKVRVKELHSEDEVVNINVGDVFEVVKECNIVYTVKCKNGWIDAGIGPDLYWNLSKENVEVVELERCYKPHVDFLPTKVVFNEAKGKTTLLFGNAPYEVVTSVVSHGDKFEEFIGFMVSMVKHLYDNHKQLFNLVYGIGDDYYLTGYFRGLVDNKLLEYGMSVSQVTKLSIWCFDKPLTFNINGVEHTIEVEYK